MLEQEKLADLVKKMQEGSFDRFDTFYQETKRPIFYNILSFVKDYQSAEDIMQDCFVKFLENIQNVDTSKSILGYLIVTSKNLSLDYLRKYSKIDDIEEVYTAEVHSQDEHHNYKMLEILKTVKNILNEKEYEIFSLHVLGELTFEEISNLLNKALGTVLWSYNNSIKKIRQEVNYEDFT